MSQEIDFYVDTLIVQTLLSDEGLSKRADGGSMTSALIEAVKHYVSNNINPEDKVGSVLNILAPGAVSMAFSAMGLPWLGILLGLAMRVFHIDVKSILSTIHSKVSEALGSGQSMSSTEVDDIVQGAVQDHAAPATESEAEQALDLLSKQKTAHVLREARMLKLAMIEFDHDNLSFQKHASILSSFNSKKSVTSSLLSRVLSWFFKIALASAGLMVAGDMINKFLGRPNALDDTIQNGKPVGETAPAPAHTSSQTKFKIQPTYHEENRSGSNWAENVSNDKNSIENMVINFAKQVYQGLDNLDSVIRSSSVFESLVDKIVFYNHTAAGDPIVFIPKYFSSKKQLVDMFIDEVAEKAP